MAVAITIRNVPESVRDAYAARASRAGMSMQEYLLRELARGSQRIDPRDEMDEWESEVAQFGLRLDRQEILDDLQRERQ